MTDPVLALAATDVAGLADGPLFGLPLAEIWFGLVFFLFGMFVFLDGFDFGTGILFATVDGEDRERLLAAIGPIFGQLGFFHKFAGREYEDKRPRDRYANESKRLLGVLETRLAGRDWLMGSEYTIADIATLGWVRNLVGFYGAGELVEYDKLKLVPKWLERGLARPAVQRGLEIPKRP